MRNFAALLIFSLIGVPCANAQQDPLDAAASEVAAAIAKAAGKHNSGAQVLVADFSEIKGHPTALGPDLARQFSLSLQAHAQNFSLSNRDKLLRQLAADDLNDAAIETVSRWKFRPATGPDGQPAEVSVQVEVRFRLYQQ